MIDKKEELINKLDPDKLQCKLCKRYIDKKKVIFGAIFRSVMCADNDSCKIERGKIYERHKSTS